MSNCLHAYKVPPHQEGKAAEECRQAGAKAYLPIETITRFNRRTKKGKYKVTVPVARGYVFAEYKPAFAKHCGKFVGKTTVDELQPLLALKDAVAADDAKFRLGDPVILRRGPHAEMYGVIASDRGNGKWEVTVTLFAKSFTVVVPEKSIFLNTHPG